MGSTKTYPDIPNPNAPGKRSYYTPAQDPPAGTALSENPPSLFAPLQIRDLRLHSRIMLSPLCQYSADDGHLTAWHMAHLGGIISRGPGLSFVEATSVTAAGRITPQDSGLWQDSQTEPLRQIVEFAHSQGQKIGIQLGHAGRKASTVAPWISGRSTSSAAVDGWPEDVWAPSTEAYSDTFPDPRALSLEDIEELKKAWAAAVKRALTAGVDTIMVHGAHGYLFHEFMSPESNKRTDKYGGSWENRTRLLFEVIDLTRSLIPKGMPLFVRISATDWMEEEPASWRVRDSIELAKQLIGRIDVLDVSSGGLSRRQNITQAEPTDKAGTDGKAYQAVRSAPFINWLHSKQMLTLNFWVAICLADQAGGRR